MSRSNKSVRCYQSGGKVKTTKKVPSGSQVYLSDRAVKDPIKYAGVYSPITKAMTAKMHRDTKGKSNAEADRISDKSGRDQAQIFIDVVDASINEKYGKARK